MKPISSVAPSTAPRYRRRAKPLLGTLVEISIRMAGVGKQTDILRVDRAIDAAFAEIAEIHRLMSFHEAHSDVARINGAAAGIPIMIDARTTEVLQCAHRASKASHYAFDCTVATELVAHGLLPSYPGSTSGARHRAPWFLRENYCIKRAPCLLDLGGIAKGYAVDCAIGALLRHEIEDALVNAGGDLRHIGSVAELVHLRDARHPGHLPLAIKLRCQALASSVAGGLSCDAAGARSALIDGVSRRPVALGTSVSIVASTCMEADLLTKVVLASGDPQHPMLERYGAHVVHYCGPIP